MAWSLRLSLASELPAFRIARKLLSHAARTEGATLSHALDIEIAVGEALSNAYLHAYGGASGPLEIAAEYDGLVLRVTISDEGVAILPRPVLPERRPGPGEGRGLYLIRRVMDEADIVPSPSGQRGIAVRMAKRLR